MARKIKFALEMAGGAKVRGSIEELREHFDLEKAVGYFLSGKLAEWLEDRFYEDEAEAIGAIEKDAPDLRERLCAALDVPYEGDSELDIAALERMNEKKAILRQKTGDEEVISHAAQTALNQEDLADLLEMDEAVIYLCGEKFNIPARVKNKKYVGILGTPTISIKAASQNELDEKGIAFENVKLPWGQAEEKKEDTRTCAKCGAKNPATAKFCNSCGASMDGTAASASAPPSSNDNATPMEDNSSDLSVEELVELYDSAASKRYADYTKEESVWEAVEKTDDGIFDGDRKLDDDDFPDGKKKMVLRVICKNKHTIDEVVHGCINEDMSAGFVVSTDGIYLYDKNGFRMDGKETAFNMVISYKDIQNVSDEPFVIGLKNNSSLQLASCYYKDFRGTGNPKDLRFYNAGCWRRHQYELTTFLNAVKDLV